MSILTKSALRYSKSLWSHNPIPGGCVLYLPTWHPNLGGLKYKSVDPFGHTVTRTASGHLHFDGSSNSSVDFGAIHDATDKLWLSFWFKLDTAFSSASSTTLELFAKYVDSTNRVECYLDQSDGKLYLDHAEAGGPETISSAETSWAADTWHHIIASMSTAAGQRMIVNGGTAVAGAGNQTAISLVASIVFGASVVDSAGSFAGEMKEVVMGTDDLSAPEEAGLYAGTLPGDETEYWPGDEGSGSTWNDQEGTADADGTIDSACTWEDVPLHQRSNGHYFDGFDDAENCSNSVLFDITPNLTILAWIYQTTHVATSRTIVCKGSDDANTNYNFYTNNGKLRFIQTDGGGADISTDSYGEGAWSQVACVISGTSLLFYIHSVPDSGNPFAMDAAIPIKAATNLYIGSQNASVKFWNDTIGEVSVYNRALSAGEIAHIYRMTRGRYL